MQKLIAIGFSTDMEMSFTDEGNNVRLVIQLVEFYRDFVFSNLFSCDVILGMRWLPHFDKKIGKYLKRLQYFMQI